MTSYSTVEVAAFCHVDRRTAHRWVESGALPSWTTGGGRHRVPAAALVAFMRTHRIPLPPALFVPIPAELHVVVYGGGEALVRAAFPTARIDAEAEAFELGLRLGRERPHLLVVDRARADAAAIFARVTADPALNALRLVVLGAGPDLGADVAVVDVDGLRAAVSAIGVAPTGMGE